MQQANTGDIKDTQSRVINEITIHAGDEMLKCLNRYESSWHKETSIYSRNRLGKGDYEI